MSQKSKMKCIKELIETREYKTVLGYIRSGIHQSGLKKRVNDPIIPQMIQYLTTKYYLVFDQLALISPLNDASITFTRENIKCKLEITDESTAILCGKANIINTRTDKTIESYVYRLRFPQKDGAHQDIKMTVGLVSTDIDELDEDELDEDELEIDIKMVIDIDGEDNRGQYKFDSKMGSLMEEDLWGDGLIEDITPRFPNDDEEKLKADEGILEIVYKKESNNDGHGIFMGLKYRNNLYGTWRCFDKICNNLKFIIIIHGQTEMYYMGLETFIKPNNVTDGWGDTESRF